MKVGVWIPSGVSKSVGGGFSYPEKIIAAIDDYSFSKGIEIIFISLEEHLGFKRPVKVISFLRLLNKLFKKNDNIKRYLYHLDLFLIKTVGLSRILKNTGIGFVLYTEQLVCLDPKFPFVSMNWDIGHLSTYPFPEIHSSFKLRDYFYNNILPQALLVSCESLSGKEELKLFTKIGDHKLRVVPLFAGNVSSLNLSEKEVFDNLQSIGLKSKSFFYYPAQFWAHKNHFGLLSAFKEYVEINPMVKLVLSGSRRSNYEYITSLVSSLGLDNNVLILGFIPNEMVYSLYKGAIALVMASHFGPTNMPPIEAMEIGCPVACSDLSGHREILGDSGVYFNSFNVNSILCALNEITRGNNKYNELISLRNGMSVFKLNEALKCLDNLLVEASVIRNNWAV